MPGNVDCLDNRVCVAGACTDRCADNGDCPHTDLRQSGVCAEGDVCIATADCDAGRACVDMPAWTDVRVYPASEIGSVMMRQRCVQRLLPVRLMWTVWVREFASTPNAKRPVPPIQIAREPEPVMKTDAVLLRVCVVIEDCADGQVCLDGECVVGCAEHDDCDGGQICVEGQCGDGCGITGCQARQQCDVVTGLCIEPDVCQANVDCLEGRICEGATCVDACQNDVDCPGTRECAEDGRCVEGLCLENDDCDNNRICDGGACIARCTEDPCPNNQVCVAETAAVMNPPSVRSTVIASLVESLHPGMSRRF